MKDNYCVIMGGGIGSRFWPFSRESYPKQFLDFFGTGRSLLQMTFDRFSKIIPIENIYIVTNEQYASLVKEQLPELGDSQILLEPARRNTAPCIAYAAYHIKACNPNATIFLLNLFHCFILCTCHRHRSIRHDDSCDLSFLSAFFSPEWQVSL